MQQHFLHCGKQRRRFSSVVGYNGISISIVGYNGQQSQDGSQRRSFSSIEGFNRNVVFSVVSHNVGVFLPLYPTPQQNLIWCTASYNTEAFSVQYSTPGNNIFFVINTTQKYSRSADLKNKLIGVMVYF
jgi:hypothetical protein